MTTRKVEKLLRNATLGSLRGRDYMRDIQIAVERTNGVPSQLTMEDKS